MSKRFLPAIILIIFISTGLITLQSCNKNGTDKKDSTKSSGNDLIKGDKISLKMLPKKGDVFRYSMVAKTVTKENSPMTDKKDVSQEQTITYYYSEEVTDTANGVTAFKVKYDSINVVSVIPTSKDSSVTIVYNSNVKDSIYKKADFIQYNSIIGEPFNVSVTPKGEVTDIYGLQKIYDKMFKAFGDTLKEAEKSQIKESFGNDAIKSVLQQQFQIFPDNDVVKDSAWTRSYDTQLLVFPGRNSLKYKITDVKTENGEVILTIDADLSTELLKDEMKDKTVTYKVENSSFNGKGTILFNLTRGCVVKKETTTKIDLNLKMSGGGQSISSAQNVLTSMNVYLMK
ncbi:MAG: hypothetical protein JST55_05215 [Bacteroidetes bacterium]|nr:hypothetical protein [Bacteroidota bacterium]